MSAAEWSVWATVAATAVTAVATAVLAWLTGVLAKETRRMADATRQPHIVATIEPCPRSLMLMNVVVSNSGTAPAYDIGVEFDPELPLLGDREAAAAPLQRVSILRPGQQLSSLLARYDQLHRRSFTVMTSWARTPNSSVRESLTYPIDVGFFEGMSPEPDALHEISRNLKQLREDWQWVARGSRRIAVDAYDERDRLRARRSLERAWRKQRGASGAVEGGDDTGA